jgi:hypothetical protein
MQWVAVPGPWDRLEFAQTACEPGRMNELPPVPWELARPVRRTSVTQAFPDAVVGAAPALEQFGLQLAKRWAAEWALEWIAAFLGSFASLVLCLSFLTVYAETRADLVPISICRCIRRSLRRSLELPYFNVNCC